VFPVGSMGGDAACATLNILDDDILEGIETLVVDLVSVSDASGMGNVVNLGSDTSGNITIEDSECECLVNTCSSGVIVGFIAATVVFSLSPNSLDENASSSFSDLTVELDPPFISLGRNITVVFMLDTDPVYTASEGLLAL